MPYEAGAPPEYEDPKLRPPSRLTRWWWALPRTPASFAITLVLAAVAWVTGIARDGRGPFVAVACVVLGGGTVLLVRKRRARS